MINLRERKLGWKPDSCDDRDYCFNPRRYRSINYPEDMDLLPIKVDFREIYTLPPIQDQGNLGSCTAHAVAFLFQLDEITQNINFFDPSRLFIYYNTRVLEGTTNYDSGAEIRTTIKSINKFGACNEISWLYDFKKFIMKPPQHCYDEAKIYTSLLYRKVEQNILSLKNALLDGNAIAFGFMVSESLNDITDDGIMPIPNDSLIGGHAVVIVGYDDEKIMKDGTKGSFIIRNSWGIGWGEQGYFYMPYNFVIDKKYCLDFWVIGQLNNGINSSHLSDDKNPIKELQHRLLTNENNIKLLANKIDSLLKILSKRK